MCQKELSQLPENSFWFSPFCFYKVLNQSELAHGGGELLASSLGGGTQGETVLLLAQPHHGGGAFDGNGIDLGKEGIDQGE